MSDEQQEKDQWVEGRYRTELQNDIEARIHHPGQFVEALDAIIQSGRETVAETFRRWQARAVCQLFETAEPIKTEPPLDLPAELLAAARMLREEAESELNDTGEGGVYEPDNERADRLGYLANVVQDTSNLITGPARILQILIRDRDRWQQAHKEQAKLLLLTEAALGQTQEANVTLAQGQSTLIELLERVARFYAGLPPTQPGPQPAVGRKADELAMLINDIVPLGAYSYRVAVEIQRALDGEYRRAPDVLPEIRATLNQVTAIEENASGRLVVAEPESA